MLATAFALLLAFAAPATRPGMQAEQDGAPPPRASQVALRVLDWRGQPLAQRELSLLTPNALGSGPAGLLADVTTDAEGRVTIAFPSSMNAWRTIALEIWFEDPAIPEPDRRESGQVAKLVLGAWTGEGTTELGDVRVTLPAWLRVRENPPLSDDELERAFFEPLAGTGPRSNFRARDLESCLLEMARRGGPRWIGFLKQALQRCTAEQDDEDSPFRWRSDAPFWIALRRAERKPDPVRLSVISPSPIEAVFPNSPVVEVQIANVDAEGAQPTMTIGGSYRSGRFERVHIDLREAIGRARRREWSSMMGGGMSLTGPLRRNEPMHWATRLGDYVTFESAGDVVLRLQYHDSEEIARLGDLTGLMVLESEPFTVRWTPRELERAAVDAVPASEILDALCATAPPVIATIPYAAGRLYSREKPGREAELFAAGWAALPRLLDALDAPDASFERRAWTLALLYDLTGAVDPRTRPGALGDYVATSCFYMEQSDFPRPWASFDLPRSEEHRDPDAQAALTERWRALRPLIRVVN